MLSENLASCVLGRRVCRRLPRHGVLKSDKGHRAPRQGGLKDVKDAMSNVRKALLAVLCVFFSTKQN